jgi:hypothetical protein
MSDGLTNSWEGLDSYVESIIECRVRAAVVAALQQAADDIATLVPYGYGMNPDGTEDRTLMGYIEGHREAWQVVTARAACYVSDTNQESGNNMFGDDFPCCTPCSTHQIRNCTICPPNPHAPIVDP